MSDPTTTYRGHTIRWSDNSDEWVCYDLSDKVRSSPKLSLIKAAIDRLYLTERKNNAVPCYELGHGGRTESRAVEYLGEKHERAWGNTPTKVHHKVAVVAQRNGSERPSRCETELTKLMPVTQEAEEAWEYYRALRNVANQANARASEAFAAIPRMTPDDVRALIDLYERDQQPAK